jgi:hypothetical protein
MKRTKLCSPAYIGLTRRRATRKFDRESPAAVRANHVKSYDLGSAAQPTVHGAWVNGMGRSFFRSQRTRQVEHLVHLDSGWERSHEFWLCCTTTVSTVYECVSVYIPGCLSRWPRVDIPLGERR